MATVTVARVQIHRVLLDYQLEDVAKEIESRALYDGMLVLVIIDSVQEKQFDFFLLHLCIVDVVSLPSCAAMAPDLLLKSNHMHFELQSLLMNLGLFLGLTDKAAVLSCFLVYSFATNEAVCQMYAGR